MTWPRGGEILPPMFTVHAVPCWEICRSVGWGVVTGKGHGKWHWRGRGAVPMVVILGTVALAGLVGAAFTLWLAQRLLGWQGATLKARDEFPIVYHPSLASFAPLHPAGDRSLLGFGFTENLASALASRARAFTPCRRFFTPRTGTVRMELKAVPESRRFRVVGLLKGVEENGEHAACLRDVMEGLEFGFLASVPGGKDDAYRLLVDLLPQVTAQ